MADSVNADDLIFKMPAKNGKRSLVTGNTLRAVDAKRRAQYFTQPVLKKSLQNGINQMNQDAQDGYLFAYKDDIKKYQYFNILYKNFVCVGNTGFTCVDEGGMLDHTVSYSLNKRQRWKLADLLKENISGVAGWGVWDSHMNPQSPPDYDVTLVEHHKIHKRADCTGVYSTRLGQDPSDLFSRKAIKPQKMHLDCNSVMKSLGNTKSRKKKGRKLLRQDKNVTAEDQETEEFVPQKPEMRYDIYYPMTRTSGVSHNKKLMLDRNLRYSEDVAHPSSGKYDRNYPGNGKYSCSRQTLWGNVHDMEDADDDVEEDIMDWCLSDYQDSEQTSGHTGENTLYDLMQSSTKKTKRIKSNKKHKKNLHTTCDENVAPRKIVYVDYVKNEPENDTSLEKEKPKADDSKGSTNDHTPEAIPVEINLEKANLETEFLDENYPKLYKTLNVLPSKILFDVTDIIKKTLSQTTHKYCDLDLLDLDSYLLLENRTDCKEVKSCEYSKVGVTMLTNYNINQLQVETIYEDGDYTMEGLLTAVAKFAIILAADSYRFKVKDKMVQRTCKRTNTASAFGMIHRATRANIRCGTADQLFRESSVWHELEGKTSLEVAQYSLTADWDVLCAICYEPIDRTNRGTSLVPCQHWTCDVCWAQYIKTQINSGAISIKCPEFKCNSVIDWPTIISFAGPSLFNRHLKSVQNITLNSDPSLIWCPRAGCGRIIVSDQSKLLAPLNVACQCGHTMCLQCKGECHWPSTCEQAKLYIEKLVKTGDIKITEKKAELQVNFKQCPKCKYPVQKNGGCPHMHCFCGYDFCWKCGKHMFSQRHGNCYIVEKDKYKFQKVLLKEEDRAFQVSSIRSKLYVQALRHRQAGKPGNMERYAKRAVILAEKVKTERANLAEKKISGTEPTKQIISSLVVQIQKRKQLSDFFVLVINTLKELHHVAEHTYIAVQGKARLGMTTCLNQLEFVISQIQMVLMDSSLKEVLSQLQYLMECAEKCVTQIAKQSRPTRRKISITGSSSDEGFEFVETDN